MKIIPRLPVLHSKDLVNWTIIGHALQEVARIPKFLRLNKAHQPMSSIISCDLAFVAIDENALQADAASQ